MKGKLVTRIPIEGIPYAFHEQTLEFNNATEMFDAYAQGDKALEYYQKKEKRFGFTEEELQKCGDDMEKADKVDTRKPYREYLKKKENR